MKAYGLEVALLIFAVLKRNDDVMILIGKRNSL